MFRRKCTACAAHQQTITLLADMIDWHRSQMGVSTQSASQAVAPAYTAPVGRPEPEERMWYDEEEEDLIAQMEEGNLSKEAAEAALAKIQAFNQTVSVS